MAFCSNSSLKLLTKGLMAYFFVTSVMIFSYVAWMFTCCSKSKYGFNVNRVRFLEMTPKPLKVKYDDYYDYDTDSGEAEDSQGIANPHPFRFLIPQANACALARDKVYILALVMSDPAHISRRSHIRHTWGHRTVRQQLNIVMLFLLGQVKSQQLMSMIQKENNEFHDIVQEDFLDVYQNLTYKSIMAFKWVTEYCMNASYILKMDDDVAFNPFVLSEFLHSLDKQKETSCEECFICKVISQAAVIREQGRKFFVAHHTYYGPLYPKYCSGPAYIVRTKMAPFLYEESFKMKFFSLEDVYITGFLGSQLEMDHMDAYQLYTSRKEDLINSSAFYHDKLTIAERKKIWFKIQEYNLNITENETSFFYE